MELSTREKRHLSTDGAILLKYLYMPSNRIFYIAFRILKHTRSKYHAAIFNLAVLSYIKTDITDYSNGRLPELTIIGHEAAQQVITKNIIMLVSFAVPAIIAFIKS